jgi:hypothetical protein
VEANALTFKDAETAPWLERMVVSPVDGGRPWF